MFCAFWGTDWFLGLASQQVDSQGETWHITRAMTTNAALERHAPGAPLASTRGRTTPLTRYAWAVIGYTLLVILFGAVVRITGSGAGCGQHWPTCHGEIAHLPERLETVIELSHRVTSGLSLILVAVLWVACRRVLPGGHLARKAAGFSVLFLVIEALLGAGLVLFQLVEKDASRARALMMPAHLTNTLLLMLSLSMTAWGTARSRPRLVWRGAVPALLLGGLALLLVVSGTGAVTALGDTLYPVSEGSALGERISEARSGSTLFERMRSLHPLLALLSVLYLLPVASYAGKLGSAAGRMARAVSAALWAQLGLGVLNVWLSAPGWMQVLHLAWANGVWVLWVLLSAESVSTAHQPRARAS